MSRKYAVAFDCRIQFLVWLEADSPEEAEEIVRECHGLWATDGECPNPQMKWEAGDFDLLDVDIEEIKGDDSQ